MVFVKINLIISAIIEPGDIIVRTVNQTYAYTHNKHKSIEL